MDKLRLQITFAAPTTDTVHCIQKYKHSSSERERLFVGQRLPQFVVATVCDLAAAAAATSFERSHLDLASQSSPTPGGNILLRMILMNHLYYINRCKILNWLSFYVWITTWWHIKIFILIQIITYSNLHKIKHRKFIISIQSWVSPIISTVWIGFCWCWRWNICLSLFFKIVLFTQFLWPNRK